MLERFKRSPGAGAPDTAATGTETGATAVADRSATTAGERDDAAVTDAGASRRFTRDTDGDGTPDTSERGATRERDDANETSERTAVHDRPAATTTGAAATPAALAAARARQRDEFGGVNWGAAFFGWLVAVGIAALLTAILAAAGAAIGLIDTADVNSSSNVEEIGVGGGIALVVVLMLAYYAGGYVAGRMSRFDGGRQGLGMWAIGLVVTILLALAAVILGDQYNVLERLNLPSLPVGDQTLATGGIVALAAIVVGTILAAMVGGKLGERYHRRIDRAGFVD